MEQQIEFKSSMTNQVLRGRFIKSENPNKKSPIVFMLTGDGGKGTKSLSWVNMPPKLAEKGISSFLFDFEGLGYSDGTRETLCLSIGISNLLDAFKVIEEQEWIDSNKIGCFAASFGAAVLLAAPEIANKLSIVGLKSPAAFIADAYFNEIGFDEFENWRKTGFSNENGYKYEVFLDCLRYNIFETATRITTPCYITQGDKDEIVPFQQTVFLYECLKTTEKELNIFKDGNHSYSNNNDWDKMASYFVECFHKSLW
tara:strand:- start:1581 stop:2348 length:768 start_codon:yes stop_codon:yes gene_type:complete